MKHPSLEQWMSFLYEESDVTENSELTRHLRSCEACQAKVQTWKRSMGGLDEWSLPSAVPSWWQTKWLKTAIAASIVLCLGFVIGQMSSNKSQRIAELKQALEADFNQKLILSTAELAKKLQVREEHLLKAAALAAVEAADTQTRQWMTEFSQTYEEHRLDDNETLRRAVTQLDSKWNARLAALRADLETLALNTETSLADTEQKLVELAVSRPTSTLNNQ